MASAAREADKTKFGYEFFGEKGEFKINNNIRKWVLGQDICNFLNYFLPPLPKALPPGAENPGLTNELEFDREREI